MSRIPAPGERKIVVNISTKLKLTCTKGKYLNIKKAKGLVGKIVTTKMKVRLVDIITVFQCMYKLLCACGSHFPAESSLYCT